MARDRPGDNSRAMKPDTPTNPLLTDASARSIRYLDGLGTRSVAPTASAIAGLKAFDERLPEKPSDPAATLRMLDEVGSPATTAMAGPRFFGFVIGGSLPVTLAANWLAGAWDQNTGLHRPTPGTSFLEQIALRWLLDLLQQINIPLNQRRLRHDPQLQPPLLRKHLQQTLRHLCLPLDRLIRIGRRP